MACRSLRTRLAIPGRYRCQAQECQTLGPSVTSVVVPSIAVRAFVPHDHLVVHVDALQSDVVENEDDARETLLARKMGAADGVVAGLERVRAGVAQLLLRAANNLQFAVVLVIKFRRRQVVHAAQPFDVVGRERPRLVDRLR